MKAKIAKEYKWSMSHRLPFHKGVCKNIHGHAYKIRVVVTGEVDENGMLIDFFDLDSAVMPIVNQLDHSFLCNETDTEMLEFLSSSSFKYNVIPMTTTAENVGYYMLQKIADTLRKHSNLAAVQIRFYENDDAYAELEMEL